MAYLSPSSTMTQTAGSSVGSPSFRKFGGDSVAGAIRGGQSRRRSAVDFSRQPAFSPGDISGAMRSQSNIMFEPKEIPGMNPLVGKSPGFEYGQNRGPDVSYMPAPNMAARRKGLTPFSMPTFSTSVFTPPVSGTTIITPPPVTPPPVTPPPGTTVEPEGGRYTDAEEKREDERLHPYSPHKGASETETEVDTFAGISKSAKPGKSKAEAKSIAEAVDKAMSKDRAVAVMSSREKARLSGRELAEVEAREDAARRGAFSSDYSGSSALSEEYGGLGYGGGPSGDMWT